ncbi:MAG: hypothetical protein WDZ94_00220 [Patescibacteria group bacterium]
MNDAYDSMMILSAEVLSQTAVYLPRIFAGLVIFIIGTTIAQLIRKVFVRFLDSIRVSKLLKETPFEQFLKNADITHKIEDFLGGIIYWLLMLVVIHTTVSVLGLESLAILLARVLSYLPSIIAAILILFIGLLVAGLLESIVKGAIRTIDGRSARFFGKLASYFVLVLAVMIALSELGIARDFILVLFTGIVAAAALAVGLAVGLGGQHVVKKLLDTWHASLKKAQKE